MGKMEPARRRGGLTPPVECKRFNESHIKPRPAPKNSHTAYWACVMIDGNMLAKGLRSLFGLSGV